MIALALLIVLALTSVRGICSFNVHTAKICGNVDSCSITRVLASKQMQMSSAEGREVIIRQGIDRDLPALAKFVADWMYPSEFPAGQRRELARLGQTDMRERYGGRPGSNSYPSALFVAEIEKEIIGCAGIDCQLINMNEKKLMKIQRKSGGKADLFEKLDAEEAGAQVVLVLANLAIRVDQRKRGYGKLLVDACGEFALENGFDDLYLLVDADNDAARKLYEKLGYKLQFRDDKATRIVTTITGLRTESSVNLCYKKSLKRRGSALSLEGLFGGLFGGWSK